MGAVPNQPAVLPGLHTTLADCIPARQVGRGSTGCDAARKHLEGVDDAIDRHHVLGQVLLRVIHLTNHPLVTRCPKGMCRSLQEYVSLCPRDDAYMQALARGVRVHSGAHMHLHKMLIVSALCLLACVASAHVAAPRASLGGTWARRRVESAPTRERQCRVRTNHTRTLLAVTMSSALPMALVAMASAFGGIPRRCLGRSLRLQAIAESNIEHRYWPYTEFHLKEKIADGLSPGSSL